MLPLEREARLKDVARGSRAASWRPHRASRQDRDAADSSGFRVRQCNGQTRKHDLVTCAQAYFSLFTPFPELVTVLNLEFPPCNEVGPIRPRLDLMGGPRAVHKISPEPEIRSRIPHGSSLAWRFEA